MSPAVVFLISLLSQLEELHLGECTKWSETSFLNIAKLRKLRKLTLEHGEDKSGFQLMLTRLTRLERLELRQWTLRNSLADVLPHMTCLQHLLLCPANGDLASTNRNVLRSCLAATDNLKQITWLVSCKSLASPQAAFDLSLAFEPGNLCDCLSGIDANSADVPASGSSLKNVSPKAREVTSTHYMCCNLKNFRHVWKPSLHQTWHMTVRQVSQGLKRCLGPRTAVCFCAEVEQ
uniref:Putative secreted protein n=1 Tax=Amblyomma triste TaxID=251400 RepID=A0A023GDQ0_AMBTT